MFIEIRANFILPYTEYLSTVDSELPYENFIFLPAVFRIKHGNDDHVEHRGSEKSAEDYVCHRTLDLLTSNIAKQQRKESQGSRRGGHQNRGESIFRSLHHYFVSGEPFHAKSVVVGDKNNSVSRSDSEHTDEADE